MFIRTHAKQLLDSLYCVGKPDNRHDSIKMGDVIGHLSRKFHASVTWRPEPLSVALHVHSCNNFYVALYCTQKNFFHTSVFFNTCTYMALSMPVRYSGMHLHHYEMHLVEHIHVSSKLA